MNHLEGQIRSYGLSLLDRKNLANYRNSATVICSAVGNGIWDFFVILAEDAYKAFVQESEPPYVIDDHEHSPIAFTRIVSAEYVQKDLKRRTAIALWIYSNAIVVTEPKDGWFSRLIDEEKLIFKDACAKLIRAKYLELRSERHNLRFSAKSGEVLSRALNKASIVKLVLELLYLNERKPYPYKVSLPVLARFETSAGEEIYWLLRKFQLSENETEIIDLSEEIIQRLNGLLRDGSSLTESVMTNWWHYLD